MKCLLFFYVSTFMHFDLCNDSSDYIVSQKNIVFRRLFFLSRLFISRITLILPRLLIIRLAKRRNINTSITVIKHLINLINKITIVRNDIDETKRFVDL